MNLTHVLQDLQELLQRARARTFIKKIVARERNLNIEDALRHAAAHVSQFCVDNAEEPYVPEEVLTEAIRDSILRFRKLKLVGDFLTLGV
jgi:hypothetical protein